MKQKLTAIQESKFVIRNPCGTIWKDQKGVIYTFDTPQEVYHFVGESNFNLTFPQILVWSIKEAN